MICKREKAHFRLTCVAQKRLCLSPLMMTGITSGAGRTPLCAAEKGMVFKVLSLNQGIQFHY